MNTLKSTYSVILAALCGWLLVSLPGCGGRAYSPRLVELDSLIARAPDSATALLAAMPDDSLRSEADRAYHALLLTQAKYKAYVPFGEGAVDTINLAVRYYANRDKEYDRQVRAFIFKACVMENLNHPDSAMYWLKQAESVAHDEDHNNNGYIRYRMGNLRMNEVMFDTITTNCYERALKHYKHLPPNIYQLRCMINLGSIYSTFDSRKGDSILLEAQCVAMHIGDTISARDNLEHLALSAIQQKHFKRTKSYALQAISLGDTSFNAYAYAAIGYSGMRQSDSASLYLGKMPPPQTYQDSMNYHFAQSKYAYALNNLDDYIYHNDFAGRIADSIFNCSQQERLKEIEENYENRLLQSQLSTTRYKLWASLCTLAAVILIVYLLSSRLKQAKREHLINTLKLQEATRQLTDMKLSIRQHSDTEANDYRVMCIDRVLRFLNERLTGTKHAPTVTFDAKFWHAAEIYVQKKFGEKLIFTDALTDSELKLFRLTCLGVPLDFSAQILGLTRKTLYNYRSSIARKITNGQNTNLDDVIMQMS